MSSSCVNSQFHLLHTLSEANPKLRTSIIKYSDSDLIEALCEICFNYLLGNIECNKSHYKELKKHSKCIRRLSLPSKSKRKNSKLYKKEINDKRKILLMQGNGFFLPLLVPLITSLGSFLYDKFTEKNE